MHPPHVESSVPSGSTFAQVIGLRYSGVYRSDGTRTRARVNALFPLVEEPPMDEGIFTTDLRMYTYLNEVLPYRQAPTVSPMVAYNGLCLVGDLDGLG